ncbi:unnamed protein product, partial [Symbiodinium microadriaticum]
MSFSDVGTEWYSRPKSIINGREDFLKIRRPDTDDPFADDDTPPLRCSLSHCSLPGASGPVVVDSVGNLLLKEDLIIALLKHRVPEHLSHIRSLRDVSECGIRRKNGLALCPITGDDLRFTPALLLQPCGCIIAEAAAKLSSSQACEACGRSVAASVPLGTKMQCAAVQGNRSQR